MVERSARRWRGAFTLIEILVVVSIIGLLVAILLPSLRRARGQAKRTVCAGNLRSIGIGFQAYLSETNDRMPYASFLPSITPIPLEGDESIYIADVLLPHTGGNPNVFKCPRDEPGRTRPEPNNRLSYFQTERSSYEYRTRLGGLTVAEYANSYERWTGRINAENSFWILRDYNNFHGDGGSNGARRYLYTDGHVTDYEN